MTRAPIALFCHRRPEHTARVLAALAANDLAAESDLVVFSDGPREDAHRPAVDAVRRLVKKATGFRSVSLVSRDTNQGLARSIIAGVTAMMEAGERAIVVEDDLVTSPHFLRFMNEALDRYATDERVISAHGYWYPTGVVLPETFFLRGAECWGWATWRRGWALFDPDGGKLLGELRRRNLAKAFDLDGAYPFTEMLAQQAAGHVDSWAIRWQASAFLAGKLTLYPGRSLVQNIGFDGTGTHCDTSPQYRVELATRPGVVDAIAVEESPEARAAVAAFFRRLSTG